MKYLIALDQGTTSSRAMIFDENRKIIDISQKEFRQIFPKPGWVEHDPKDILNTQLGVLDEVIGRALGGGKAGAGGGCDESRAGTGVGSACGELGAESGVGSAFGESGTGTGVGGACDGIRAEDIAAIGITNQRETTIVWDKRTGEPVYNAIVWQCRRTADYCEELKAIPGMVEKIREKTGLLIDSYFSATKIKWILENVPGLEPDNLLFGTVDTWLLWNMTCGKVHVTDYTNASRTMLFNIKDLCWDKELLEIFGIPESMLPEVRSSAEVYGTYKVCIGGDEERKVFGIYGKDAGCGSGGGNERTPGQSFGKGLIAQGGAVGEGLGSQGGVAGEGLGCRGGVAGECLGCRDGVAGEGLGCRDGVAGEGLGCRDGVAGEGLGCLAGDGYGGSLEADEGSGKAPNENFSIFEIPISGMAGDQQCALFGQRCFAPGQAKNSYGTGCFLLMNMGEECRISQNGLITTIGIGLKDRINYAIEGSVFIGSAVIEWLRDGLKIIESASASSDIAASLEDNGGVYFVPAFTGLGAPYWDMYARGAIMGITRGTTDAHIVRAAVESMAFQTMELLDAMIEDSGIMVSDLNVDGGACRDSFLMQFQADVSEINIIRPKNIETTALGAALLAGLGVGLWKSPEEIDSFRREEVDRVFYPQTDRKSEVAEWKACVGRTLTRKSQG